MLSYLALKEVNGMETILLAGAVFAALLFGFVIVKKLDDFLNLQQTYAGGCAQDCLCLAFETPALAAAVSDLLKRFSKRRPNCGVRLFFGSAEAILEKLSANEVDFGFMTTGVQDAWKRQYRCAALCLKCGALVCESTGIPVAPLENAVCETTVLWHESRTHLNRALFAALLSQRSMSQRDPGARGAGNPDGKML